MVRWIIGLLLAASSAYAGRQVSPPVDTTLSQLSKIHLDRLQIHSVRDLTINRDVLSISLNRGAIAFTEAVSGKVTGAVFIGSGDVLAIPPDAVEKQQLFRYTRSALLNEHFETAIFRFTDGTFEEVLKEIRSHAPETVDPADVEALTRWESELQRRATYLNERILADLIGSPAHPIFLAQIEGAKLGWFDAIYDDRSVEEVLIEQSTMASNTPLVWASFNKRSEARDPAGAAHEDKLQFEVVSINSGATSARLKLKADGERVLILPIPSAGVTGVSLEGMPVPFVSGREHLVVILPEPSRSGREVTLKMDLAEGQTSGLSSLAPRSNNISPASYRDQWIIEGIAGYASALSDPVLLNQAREQLLAQSPEGGSYASLGPVWIGFRMMQPRVTPGYTAALRNKSVWIFHMLKNVMQREEGDPVFGQLLDDILAQYRGKPFSTFDLLRLAEKHAGKPLDWFFDDWVFGTGIPAYAVTFKADPTANGFAVSGNITQSGVPDTFEMPVPLYADDTFLGNVIVSGSEGEFHFTSKTRPQKVLIDPKKTILTRID